jgi:hypothetical protein
MKGLSGVRLEMVAEMSAGAGDGAAFLDSQSRGAVAYYREKSADGVLDDGAARGGELDVGRVTVRRAALAVDSVAGVWRIDGVGYSGADDVGLEGEAGGRGGLWVEGVEGHEKRVRKCFLR